MTKDQELVEKIAKWCAISCKSDLPYQFHAKEIISLCRQHDIQMAIEAVESTSHKPASCLTSTKLKILNEAISAIRAMSNKKPQEKNKKKRHINKIKKEANTKVKMNKDQELVEKIKPCPFCGGGVELHGRNNGWTIECYNCNVSMNIIDAPSVIVKQWNCRQHVRTATLDEVTKEFPDIDDEPDQEKYPCEWVLWSERKRGRKAIDNLRGHDE